MATKFESAAFGRKGETYITTQVVKIIPSPTLSAVSLVVIAALYVR